MTIWHTNPFATPEGQRSPVRRLRGRLPAAVTLWTAGTTGSDGAGFTVSATLFAAGDPGRILGLIDDESDLWAAIEATGRFAVAALRPAHRQLADRFAGILPAPGGMFATGDWRWTEHGPVPADAGSWAGCRLDQARRYGFALLVEATIEHVELAPAGEPLVHYHGRYRELR